MKRNSKKVVLHLLCMAFLVMAFACENGARKTEEKKKQIDLAFVDWSRGLPSIGQWRQGLAFYDINNDGYTDILATPRREAPIDAKKPVVWYGNAKGEWSQSFLDVPSDIPYDYGSIGVSDFNGDAIPDIALSMHYLGLKVLNGTRNGKYGNLSPGLPTNKEFISRALVCADLNKDGVLDIAAVSEYQQGAPLFLLGGLVGCYLQENKWNCRAIGSEKETRGLLSDQLVAGDVNSDGNVDIAVASFNHLVNLIVWLGDGKGNFQPYNKGLPNEKHYNSVALADVDGDGRDDLIASISFFGKDSFKGVKAFLSGPDTFTDMSEGLPAGEESRGYFAAAGDLNGDGRAEIIAAPKGGGLKVFSLKGDRWNEVRTSGLPEKGLYRIYNMYCLDINKDGRKDIVVIYANSNDDSGGIRVFLNAPEKK
jgi:hypothetical protein